MLMGTAFTAWYNHTMATLARVDDSTGTKSISESASVAVRDTNVTEHRYYETCDLGTCGADTC